MKLQEFLKTEFTEDDSAVSPVIGVILMVAITVILAAVIATFVLGLGDQVQSNPQAGVSFELIDDKGNVQVTFVSEGNVDPSTVKYEGCGKSGSLSGVGASKKITGCSDGDTIVVTASTPDGASGVIGQYTVSL